MKQKVISLLFFVTVIAAQWSTDAAAPQSLGSGINAQVAATSDGGVYVAWLSDGNNYHVYLQRLNSLGEPQLGDNGMVVSDNANASWIAVFHLNLAVDSEDNAIITIVDQRTGGQWEVYAYKIASDGSMLWGDDGIALTTSSTSNMSPRLTLLPDNSVVVTWTHNDNTVLFQRISSAGVLLWGTGILISDNNANLLSPQPIATGEGDVLIQWIRQTGPFWAANSELYLQKYDHDGIAQWSNPIVAAGPVVFPMGNWLQQSVADADSGSFSAWTEMSGNVQSAVVQHITGDGALSWTGGVELSTNTGNFRMSPKLTVAEDTQELMAVWSEANGSQSQRGVYAQRLDSSGNRLWGSNGSAVVGLNSNYDYLDLSVAGFGDDMIAAYIEQSVNTNGDIYADRLDTNGNNVWAGGAATVTNSGSSKSDMMIDKGTGCLFIAWTENDSVYIHCLREDGTLGGPYNFSPTDFSLTEPSNNTEIMIDASNVDDGSITFSWGESSDANDDALYYFMRATSAEIGNYGFGTTATSIGVSYMDIIEDMAENNVTVATLEWTVHVTDGIDTVEADNAPFTVAIDGGYAMSTFSEALIPEVFALHQNYPNPFNPVTTLRYDLPENSYVNVTVYDMIGREVRTLVNTTQDAGFKSVIWDATNDYGKPVSAGVYLYKIQAGEYISTKKMVLLK